MDEPTGYLRGVRRKAPHAEGPIRRHFKWCLTALRYCALTPLSTLLTMAAVGMAIVLPTELALLQQAATAIERSVDASDLSIYLSPTLSDTDLNTHLTALRARSEVAVVRVISPAESLAELAAASELKTALTHLPSQSLPTTVIVRPTLTLSVQRLRTLADELGALPGVDQVRVDLEWSTHVHQVSAAGRQFFYRVAASLIVTVLLLIGVTLHWALAAYRGGQRADAALPSRATLVYLAATYGFGGGALAWAFHTLGARLFAKPVGDVLTAVGLRAQVNPMDWPAAVLLLAIGTLVCATAALLLTAFGPSSQDKRRPIRK